MQRILLFCLWFLSDSSIRKVKCCCSATHLQRVSVFGQLERFPNHLFFRQRQQANLFQYSVSNIYIHFSKTIIACLAPSALGSVITSVCTRLSGKFCRLFRYKFLPYSLPGGCAAGAARQCRAKLYACEFLPEIRQNYARKYVYMTYNDTT